MPDAYGAFAYAYDKALGARFFQAVRGLLDDAIGRHCGPRRTHLDVACGTGLALEHLAARGWRSTGLDASVSMLHVARSRVEAARLVAADARSLPFRNRFALVTCMYDSLNHLMDRSDLVAAFRAVRGVMDEDSRFIFDMNHPEIYPAVWGLPEPFVSSGPDYSLEIDTSFRAREQLGRATVKGWALIAGERVEISEQHQQRAYSEREIGKALADADLAPLEVLDFDPYYEGGPTVKLFYVCGPR